LDTIQISKTNYEKISVESWRNFVAALPVKKMISQKFSDFEKLLLVGGSTDFSNAKMVVILRDI
jgi:hypothetical protein